MTDNDNRNQVSPTDTDLWTSLRRLTAARIGLKRAGVSMATAPWLDFQLAHARARDAVHGEFDGPRLAADLAGFGLPVLTAYSAAADKRTYLMRPDLGRKLSPQSEAMLKSRAGTYDAVFVISDGLSAGAVQSHTAPLLAAALPNLAAAGWRLAPLVVVRHARVAIGDAIAILLGADSVAVLIGERPGLSAPDSMGAYVTWRPGLETSDADRNCISNIRPAGIGYADATFKLTHLMRSVRERRLSGVRLKDSSDGALIGNG